MYLQNLESEYGIYFIKNNVSIILSKEFNSIAIAIKFDNSFEISPQNSSHDV